MWPLTSRRPVHLQELPSVPCEQLCGAGFSIKFLFVGGFFFFPPPTPERGEVLGLSANDNGHGSPHMDPFKGLQNFAPKHLQQNSLSAMVSAWPTHIEGIYERIENTGRAESCTEMLFLKNKILFFSEKTAYTFSDLFNLQNMS